MNHKKDKKDLGDEISKIIAKVGKRSPNKSRKKHKWRLVTATGEEIKQRRTMRFWFSCVVLVLFSVTCCFTAALFYIINGILELQEIYMSTALLIGAVAMSCIIVGMILTGATSRYILNRINNICHGMLEISKGNYKTRVKENDKGKALSEFGELERSFNQMASELDGIEIFRNDFINDFSHEFKTPIVSIRGFARQLQNGNLSPEQKKEYLSIIIDESERLSNMAANVLILNKLENQQIVSDKTDFFLDEQIRSSLLLLERQWSTKNIELDLDLQEIKYHFNEEMMSHVWINLFSNAIKFTADGGCVGCSLYTEGSCVLCKIYDTGEGMDKTTISRIFEKFYQGDTSHATAGNGIGLNIAQRVVALARGEIHVESELGKGSTFTVILPYQNNE